MFLGPPYPAAGSATEHPPPPVDPQIHQVKFRNEPVFEIGHSCYHVILPWRVYACVTCFHHMVSHTHVHQNCSFSSCSFIHTWKTRQISSPKLPAGWDALSTRCDGFLPSLFAIQQSWQYWHYTGKVKKNHQKGYLQWALNLGPLPFQFNTLQYELTCLKAENFTSLCSLLILLILVESVQKCKNHLMHQQMSS